MTMVSFFTHSFWQVLFPRILFAVFESACIPACVSLINDLFDPQSLGRANSFFSFGVYLGIGLSSLTLLMDKSLG